MTPIYLDYNATTPVAKEVADAMRPFLYEYFGNPSSSHEYGIKTKVAVENARKQISDLLNCKPNEIVFTSGGTESNNYAIKGIAFSLKHLGNHIITSSVEHPAVLEVCKYLENFDFRVTYLPVNEFGMVNVEDVKNAITPETILITILHANNEVGTIQPIEEIAAIAKQNSIIMHSDGAQSVGKIETNVAKLGVDLFSVAGHKLYAPKGIGVLFIKNGIKLEKLIHGADHEQNLRAGTENVLEIVGLGKACEIAKSKLNNGDNHLAEMRDLLQDKLLSEFDFVKLNGHPEKRLPNTLSLSFRNIEANTLLLSMEEVAASAGAACHADNIEVSTVLTAMKVPIDYAMGTVRFSTGRYSTKDEILRASEIIIDSVNKLMPDKITEPVSLNLNTGINDVKLTHVTHGLGCACKLRPQDLEHVLTGFRVNVDENILVSNSSADDAAAYKINSETAIIQTVDFFTPIVDDPYNFGAISAANSLSDIYAMGGKPSFALNIVGFPAKRLPMSVLSEILRGASDKCSEAGISILGGHTIEDNEPKFGLVVSGFIHPDKILMNSNAQEGDAIILTKPIGTGIIATAIKRGLAKQSTIDKSIKIMSALNNKPTELFDSYNIHACTDVTGFGLLGHLKEMTVSSKLNAEIYCSKVPFIDEAVGFATAGIIPGGTKNNMVYVKEYIEWNSDISEVERTLLCDAQTSGGLLISLSAELKDDFINRLIDIGVDDAVCIGYFTESGKGMIKVI